MLGTRNSLGPLTWWEKAVGIAVVLLLIPVLIFVLLIASACASYNIVSMPEPLGVLTSEELPRLELFADKVTSTSTKATSTIESLLSGKTATQKSDIKSTEIVKRVAATSTYTSLTYGYTIELRGLNSIPRGIEVLARAWDTLGNPVGFGPDGTVEWERFRIYNPPIKVPDGTKSSTTTMSGKIVLIDNFKEDPPEALRQVIAHNVKIVGKSGSNIILGKIGSTTSTFYPDADPESSSVDGTVTYSANPTTWQEAHDAATGTSLNDTDANRFVGVQNANPQWNITRGLFFYDTSPLGDTDTIDSATLSLYSRIAPDDDDNDGNDFIAIVHSTSTSVTALVLGDYGKFGIIEQHDVGQRKDLTTMGSGVYVDWTLNSTGVGNVSKTTLTRFGAREGHDLLNIAVDPTFNTMYIAFAETAGTTQDPKLVVVHTSVAAAADFWPPYLISGD